MGVGELKRCMVDAGMFVDPLNVVEKADIIQIFVNSGRLVTVQYSTRKRETEMCRPKVVSTRAQIQENTGTLRKRDLSIMARGNHNLCKCPLSLP
jgi:hypothetical protein